MVAARVLYDDASAGIAFAIAPRLALTANHVVRARDPSLIRLMLADGRALSVGRIEEDEALDIAVLHLAEDAPASEVRVLGRARVGAVWRVEAQPTEADAFLTGTINAERQFVNARGHSTQVIQLLVNEVLGEYEGYSGSPVALDESGIVVGVLVEQLRQRIKARAGQTRPGAANVLYAIPIRQVLDRFKLEIAIAFPPETRLPTLPQNAVPREDERRPVTRDLLSDADVAVSGGRRIALVGMAGTGKTVLAAQVAGDPEVRAAFGSEVFWLTLDKTPITQHQARLAAALGEGEVAFKDWQHGRDVLARRLSGSPCLLILDNISEAEELDAFDVLGPRGRLLFTTRYADLANSYGASVHAVGLFTPSQARRLLAHWAMCNVTELPEEAERILGLCGGLPLAIAMAGAMVRGQPARWRTVLAKLRAVNPARIAAQLPGYPHPNLLAALDVSVEELNEVGEERGLRAARERYADWAVFAGRGAVPRPALARMWSGAGVGADLVEDYVELFIDHSLATSDEEGRLRLHDLQMASVVARARDQLSTLHSRLLDGYASACPAGWASLLDDGYILQHLIHHLILAGRGEEATALLLDYAWAEKKLLAAGVSALLADYTLIPDSEDVTSVQEALRLSAHILSRDPAQLATQLVGRTFRLESPSLRALHEAAQEAAARAGVPWFRVMHPVLHMPGGALIRTIQPPPSSITSVIPRRRWVAAYPAGESRHAIAFYDLMTGDEIRQIELEQERSPDDREEMLTRLRLRLGLGCVLSPAADGSRLLVINDDECACAVFDLTTWGRVVGCSLRDLTAAHSGGEGEADATGELPEITAALLLKGGTRAVIAFSGGEVVLADLTDGRAVRRYRGLSGRVYLIRVDGGEERLAAVTEGSEVMVWNLASAEQVRRLRGPIEHVKDLVFFGDGRRLLAVGENAARFVDGEIFDPTGSNGLVWDIDTGEPVVTFTASEGIFVSTLFADDSRFITGHRGGWIHVWDTATGACLRGLRAHNDIVTEASVLDEGKLLVTASNTWDGSVRLWDMSRESGAALNSAHVSGRVEAIGFFDEGRKALTASGEEVKVWDVATGTCEHTFECSRWNIRQMMLSGQGPDTPDYSAQLRALVVQDINDAAGSESVAVYDQGRRVAIGLADGRIKIRDLQTGTCLRSIPGHSTAQEGQSWGSRNVKLFRNVKLLIVLGDERRVLTSSWDTTLRLWSLETGECLAEFRGHSSLPNCATLFDDDRRLISGGLDGEVRLWDTAAGECLAVLSGHEDWVQGVATLAGGEYAVSASHDRTLRLWNLTARRQISRFDGETLMSSLAAAPDGRTLVAGDYAGRVYFLRVEGLIN